MRSTLGGLAPLFSNKMYDRLEVGWMFSLLAIVVLIIAPMPWTVYRFGEGWRHNERLSGDAMSEESVTERKADAGDAGDADGWGELTVVVGKQQV
jgi:hypothetical protein